MSEGGKEGERSDQQTPVGERAIFGNNISPLHSTASHHLNEILFDVGSEQQRGRRHAELSGALRRGVEANGTCREAASFSAESRRPVFIFFLMELCWKGGLEKRAP